MIKIVFYFVILLFIISSCIKNNETSQWRGPNRNGIYQEENLLKQWPENGPELIWSNEGLGYGFGSVAIANGKVYVTGIADTIDSKGTLFSFNIDGELLWKKEYGADWTINFQGTRSTPTVVGKYLYVESGVGEVYCFNSNNGEEIWSVNFLADLEGDSILFGFSESVLIDGDLLICTPGGKENNVVALNRFTGEKIWSSPGYGEIATYNSPIVFDHNGQRMIVVMTSGSIMGIDAFSGKMYWRVNQFQENKIHANTPIYHKGKVLVSSASRKDSSGLVLLELSEDGKNADILWRNKRFINLMGGVVYKDDYIYGSAYLKNDWQVIDCKTGEMVQQNKDIGGGSIIYADGLFYCYSERDGEISLMDASPEKMKIVSKFKVPLGINEHWARPVIHNRRLYIRHGNALMVYNISGL
jgi:outer membrane protein assembly factor BamB